jgi:CII-binding regulator of phage lambda lysogenization HflD
MVAAERKLTDTLPRASIRQILDVVRSIAAEGRASFDEVRVTLVRSAARKAPASLDAKWTTARDILAELQRLGYVVGDGIPRQKAEVSRLRLSVFEITDTGQKLAQKYKDSPSYALDEFFQVWLRQHAYFRAFIARLLQSPIYVPDITSLKELGGYRVGQESPESVATRVADSCTQRLTTVGTSGDKPHVLTQTILDRFAALATEVVLASLDAKALVDAIQDRVVIPAFLAAEGLQFDGVTFQHLVKASQEFFVASWTSSHPDFAGRVIFSTCDVEPAPSVGDDSQQGYHLSHHGRSYAAALFESALTAAYERLARSSSAYVSAYALRALVCVELRIQPLVFSACLEHLMRDHPEASGLAIYTEIPFEPPPKSEPYVEVGKSHSRVGRLKISAS